ncbi:hypothetical protein HQ520_16320 [bacterium]|nr:hypothetical protein [bacterium]
MSEAGWMSIIVLACGLIGQLVALAFIAGRVTNRLEVLDSTMKNGVVKKLDHLDQRTGEILRKQGEMQVRFEDHQEVCLKTFQIRKNE